MASFQLNNNHSPVNWYLVAVKDSGYWHHAIGGSTRSNFVPSPSSSEINNETRHYLIL
ncbi:hypothetical protein Peur_006152 [Populus x canadensis]